MWCQTSVSEPESRAPGPGSSRGPGALLESTQNPPRSAQPLGGSAPTKLRRRLSFSHPQRWLFRVFVFRWNVCRCHRICKVVLREALTHSPLFFIKAHPRCSTGQGHRVSPLFCLLTSEHADCYSPSSFPCRQKRRWIWDQSRAIRRVQVSLCVSKSSEF